MYDNNFSKAEFKPEKEFCPISKVLYSVCSEKEAYEHQAKHVESLHKGKVKAEYLPEQYIAPEGYILDGTIAYKTVELEEKVIENNGKKSYYYVAPEGYRLNGNNAIKTVNAAYRCEGILVKNNITEEEDFLTYEIPVKTK